MEEIRINDRFTVGTAQPDRDDLQQLADEGFRTIVNLRTAEEEEQTMAPDEEGEEARSQGLEYVHIPVSADELDDEVVDQFRDELSRRPKPIFVHCASGKRSGALTMLHLAAERGMTGDEVLERAEALGFECDSERLVEFVKRYADSHARAA